MWESNGKHLASPRGRAQAHTASSLLVVWGKLGNDHDALGIFAHGSGSRSIEVTSVDDALSLVGAPAPAVLPVAAPHPSKVSTRMVATPRATPTLTRRRQWERQYRLRLQITDAFVVLVAASTSTALQLASGLDPLEVGRMAIIQAALWIAMLSALRSRDAAILGSGPTEYKRVVNASGVAFGLLAATGVLLGTETLRIPLLVAMPFGILGLLAARWLWRRWLQNQRRRGSFASRTLVVGDRADVEYVIQTLRKGAVYGYNVIGATLLDGNAREIATDTSPVPVLGNVTSVAEVATRISADTILVASRPSGSPNFIKRLSWQLEGTAAELVLSSQLTDVAGPRISFTPVDGLPLIQVQIPTYEGGQHILKRALDIAVSAVAILGIALITPVIALFILIDSRGPLFFLQERVGRDGQTFRMVKFRSMHIDAEQKLAALQAQNEGSGLLFKMKDDPRITRVGRVLRKFSLDELPQFWNVLVGEMSVVGPRPPLPSEVRSYNGKVHRRLYIKPGITGLWQISGRSDLSWEESVRLDLRYVENWSVVGDLQIMWRTAKVMIRPTGAY